MTSVCLLVCLFITLLLSLALLLTSRARRKHLSQSDIRMNGCLTPPGSECVLEEAQLSCFPLSLRCVCALNREAEPRRNLPPPGVSRNFSLSSITLLPLTPLYADDVIANRVDLNSKILRFFLCFSSDCSLKCACRHLWYNQIQFN